LNVTDEVVGSMDISINDREEREGIEKRKRKRK
jgi:hypothetical protein